MRRVSRLALVAWSSIAFGGCATIAGLDKLDKDACAFGCDDATNPSDSPADNNATDDQTVDSPGKDVAKDTPSDDTSPVDANDADDASTDDGDAPIFDVSYEYDTGCGPLNVPDNCGACGVKCAAVSTSVKTRACNNGSSCNYTCNSQWLDCNASLGTNTDGCECNTPGVANATCCGTSCPVQHNNGLGQVNSKFFDCVQPGTINAQLAADACAAFTGNPAQCTQGQCVGPDGGPNGDLVECATGSPTDCVCWTYQGPNKGYVHDPSMPPNNCFCADKTLDPAFN